MEGVENRIQSILNWWPKPHHHIDGWAAEEDEYIALEVENAIYMIHLMDDRPRLCSIKMSLIVVVVIVGNMVITAGEEIELKILIQIRL